VATWKKKWPKQYADHRPKATPRSDLSLDDCGCVDVAPWEDCEHTWFVDLDPDAAAHMRAIALG
jgi:hypothetical protein